MEVDLYQRRGFGAVDPVTGIDSSAGLDLAPAPVAAAPVSSTLASVTSGFDLSSMSPTTLLVLGAGGLWFLSTLFSGTKRVYRKVALPIKKHKKRKLELEDARERYERERKRIAEGGRRRR